MKNLVGVKYDVLDHGFVRVVDYMGDDAAIVQAARGSYGKGTKTPSEDKALIHYLMRHWHTTPFEMCEIKFHVKLPIFVARQWIRHRTANVNEYSARYSILDKEFYVPDLQHICAQSSDNKQGRSEVLSEQDAYWIQTLLRGNADSAYAGYEAMLEKGLARELARMNLPVNYYTQWYWKIDLHNLMHFLMLRADAHAQYEIRAYAEVMLEIVKAWVPFAYEAFEEYRLHATRLSRTATQVLKRMLAGEQVTQENSGLGAREWKELKAVFA